MRELAKLWTDNFAVAAAEGQTGPMSKASRVPVGNIDFAVNVKPSHS